MRRHSEKSANLHRGFDSAVASVSSNADPNARETAVVSRREVLARCPIIVRPAQRGRGSCFVPQVYHSPHGHSTLDIGSVQHSRWAVYSVPRYTHSMRLQPNGELLAFVKVPDNNRPGTGVCGDHTLNFSPCLQPPRESYRA